MSREAVRLTLESTWGSFASGGATITVDLTDSNPYSVRPAPSMKALRSAGAYNRRNKMVPGPTKYPGSLSTLVYPTHAIFWASLLNSSGTGDLPSVTIDHMIQMDDTGHTKIYTRDLGVRVEKASFATSEDTQELSVKLDLQGKDRATITGTDFPEPAATAYPAEAPFVFTQTSGAYTIGSARGEPADFSCDISNKLDVRCFNNGKPKVIQYTGRDVDWKSTLAYIVTTDRTNYEGIIPVSGSVAFTAVVGAETYLLTFNMGNVNYYAGVEDNLDPDKIRLQALSLQSFFDPTAGTPTDFTLTATMTP